jgi:protease-4
MSLETEAVIDRRRLRRSISFWRTIAVLAAVAVLAGLALGSDQLMGLGERKQIARVTVEGMIFENREQLRLLERIAEAKHVEGLIVFINSGGGTTTGGEALYDALRRVSATKPVVAQFGTVAASAAYITGLATDHIVARGNTITGSVGVILQWAELSQLMDKLGVKVNEIKTGPLKANPSMFSPLDEAGQQAARIMVDDSFKWFLSLVSSRRNVATAAIPGLEQGRVYSGREALGYKLIDEIGGEAEAVRWMEEKRGVTRKLKVVDWKPKKDSGWAGLSGAAGSFVASLLGLDGSVFARLLGEDSVLGRLGLDGLVSVWHPHEK